AFPRRVPFVEDEVDDGEDGGEAPFKLKIEEEKLAYEVPERPELEGRLAAVLAVVYLVFNEGHTAREGPLLRLDLQAEAMRLARELCDLLPNEGEVFG